MSTLLELLLAVLLLVFIIFVWEKVKATDLLSGGASSAEEPVSPAPLEVRVVKDRSPFRERSYRDEISIPFRPGDVVGRDVTRDRMEEQNARSLSPDEDSPYTMDVRSYDTFRRALHDNEVADEDKRLVLSEIDKVVGTEFARYYRDEIARLRVLLSDAALDEEPSSTLTTSADEVVTPSGFAIQLPKKI